ncbi:hypothetical protein LR007_03420 [candidate division NPL-UPA2 bacterium]|nr:hypothetical protein [candidate division NPL-UPA2 bacterium]
MKSMVEISKFRRGRQGKELDSVVREHYKSKLFQSTGLILRGYNEES